MIVLEQLKNSVPANVATYLAEHEARTPSQAAVLADEYALLNKNAASAAHSRPRENQFRPKTTDQLEREQGSHDKFVSNSGGVCHYGKQSGHWKGECELLKARSNLPKTPVRPAALANSLPSSLVAVSSVECDVPSKQSEG